MIYQFLPDRRSVPLILHGRRPRIQKMKCLAQKLTKWRRIKNCGKKAKLKDFQKLRDLHYVKVATDH